MPTCRDSILDMQVALDILSSDADGHPRDRNKIQGRLYLEEVGCLKVVKGRERHVRDD